MNISDQPLDPNFLRRIPTYGEEPQMGEIQFNDPNYRENKPMESNTKWIWCAGCDKFTVHHDFSLLPEVPNRWKCNDCGAYRKAVVENRLGGRSVLNAKIKELMQSLDTERKRSARWKKACSIFYWNWKSALELTDDDIPYEEEIDFMDEE